MDATSRSDDASRGSVEVLILQLTLTAAVNGEGEVRTEGLYIEVVHALADLFVRGEADADTPVGELGMLEDVAYRLHDLGDTRLVIRSEERRPISRDERMLKDLQQLGELLYREHGIITEGDGRTIVVLDDLRADTTAREVGARIDM